MFDLLETLLGGLFGPFIPFLQAVKPYVLFILIGLVAVACGIRFGTPFVLGLVCRLVTRTPRSLFKAKAELLTNDAICEMYAPANQYITDREEGKKGGSQFAWLSPFPRAVKASIKRNPVSRNRKLNARAQVAAAAKHIHVREPHPADNVAGELEEHYRIDMRLDGHDEKEIEKLKGRVKAQLGLREVDLIKTSDTYTLSMIAHKTEPVDILTERKAGAEFFTEHAAKTPYSLPVAITEDGGTWNYPMKNGMILGTNGSGKGSALHGIIAQLVPFVEQGIVELYGIDTKTAELSSFYKEASFFKETVDEPEQAQELIADLLEKMTLRQKRRKIDIDNAELGRKLTASRENPMTVLLIDEALDLLLDLQSMGKSGKETINKLNQIMAKGRAPGFFVILATQAADTELLGRMKNNLNNKLVLRFDNPYFNKYFLGEEAVNNGNDPNLIPEANEGNGYATAGIGYVMGESGSVQKVRFAFSSDEDIAELIKAHRKVDDFDSFGGLPELSREDDEAKQSDGQLSALDDLGSLPDLNDDEEIDA